MSTSEKNIIASQVTEIEKHSSSTSQNDSPHRPRTARKASAFTTWSREVISCALSVATLMAMFVLLRAYQNKPLPSWPKGISINTILAILIVVFKGSLLLPVTECICQLKWKHFRRPQPLIDLIRFDSASREPLGSALLLLRMPRDFLVAMGAVITIGALAIGPFCQQLVHFVECEHEISYQQARIARTNNYSIAGPHSAANQAAIDEVALGALYRGIFNPPQDPASMISFACDTGNCTFPTSEMVSHMSLGICHSFEDINSTVSVVNNSSAPFSNTSLSSAYQLSSGLVLDWPSGDCLVTQDVTNNFTGSLITFDTLMMKYVNCEGSNGDPPCEGLYPYAFRSSLFPCVRTYNASVQKFVVTENIVSTLPIKPQTFGYGLGLVTERTLRNGTWHECTVQSQPTTENPVAIPIVDPSAPSSDIPSSTSPEYYPTDCVYQISPEAHRSLDNIKERFVGSNGQNGQKLTAISSRPDTPTSGPNELVILANRAQADPTSINSYLFNIALSMTADFRNRGDSNTSGWTTGSVFQYDTCIQVRWAWISLPAALTGLTIVFLGLVAVQTAGISDLPAWKSSGLPLVLSSLEGGDVAHRESPRFANMRNTGSLETTAGTVKAVLVMESDGRWRFVESG